ncbi:MAG: hypothetical protein LLG06_15870 [Desulfobacteraceae bacterium]|nr:hypothetical protein [Desulfobacteraceae bacterium]
MRKGFSVLMTACALLAPLAIGWAASDGAMKLRAENGLTEFKVPATLLSGNFVADEIDPRFVFGKVDDFVKSRSCATTWLIDENEKRRVEAQSNQTEPLEYTLYLEEDCPDKVAYYIFVDRSQARSAQWMEWRKQFHKSKAEPQYAAVDAALAEAGQKGFQVDAELRFVEIGGNLILKKTEEFVTDDLKLRPIYDLKAGKAAQQ